MCLAYSDDGIVWEKPCLGLFEYDGSTDNNIILGGRAAHNFAPMLDDSPGCLPNERFKAVSGHYPEGLFAYSSPDGLHWEKIQEEPVATKGTFDSHNLCFYDWNTAKYRCYSRFFALPKDNRILTGFWPGSINIGVRSIQSCESSDFRSWTELVPNSYEGSPEQEQFYTNATVLCPGARHHYLSFPMRFMAERFKNEGMDGRIAPGVSDAVFISSRDGVNFDRSFMEAWIRPSLSPKTWTPRNFVTGFGIMETTPEEFSLYVNENYMWDDSCIRRYTVRRHGFASINAPHSGGIAVTKPFIFSGNRLTLNYSTSAAGHVRVGIVSDATGWPAPEYSAEDCDIIYGNELEGTVSWRGNPDVGAFSGKPVRLKFEMKDADIYSIRFTSVSPGGRPPKGDNRA